MTNIEQIEITINETCELLDNAITDYEKKLLEAKLFELVEQLNGNTIYLTMQ
jgi:Mor family transcriptional regulator